MEPKNMYNELEEPEPEKRIEFEIDFKFWALIPSVNLNLHTSQLEIEWLFVGVYITFSDYEKQV